MQAPQDPPPQDLAPETPAWVFTLVEGGPELGSHTETLEWLGSLGLPINEHTKSFAAISISTLSSNCAAAKAWRSTKPSSMPAPFASGR